MIYYLPTIESNQKGYERLAALAKETKLLRASRLELNCSAWWFWRPTWQPHWERSWRE